MKCILLSIFRDEALSPTMIAALEETREYLCLTHAQFQFEVLYGNRAHLTVENVGSREMHDRLQDDARKYYHERLSMRK